LKLICGVNSKAAAETKAAAEAKAKAEAVAKAAAEAKAKAEKAAASAGRRSSSLDCQYWLRCQAAFREFADKVGFDIKPFLHSDHNRCFCNDCHTSRRDKNVYTRGNPGKEYVLPIGFARLGLHIFQPPPVVEASRNWHVCYHGTKHDSIFEILKQGRLLKPGDPTYTGRTIAVRQGHIEAARARKNLHTGKQEDFDPTKKIFFSPSIKYCDYGDVYMTSFVSDSKRKYRFAFQVYLQSGQYEIGQETVGARDTLIDDNVPNNSIEWYTPNGIHVLSGLLIREEVEAADKAAAEKAAAAARKKADALAEAASAEKAGVFVGGVVVILREVGAGVCSSL
jgi:hypothetical protein